MFTQFCRSSCLLVRQASIKLSLRSTKPTGQYGFHAPFVTPSTERFGIKKLSFVTSCKDLHYAAAFPRSALVASDGSPQESINAGPCLPICCAKLV